MLNQQRLNRIAKITAEESGLWAEGIDLKGRTGKDIKLLMHRAAKARFAMAQAFQREGDAILSAKISVRSAISRHYYAFYHAARAVVYADVKGDDYEKHALLPLSLPATLPNVGQWKNNLKDARDTRNRADYELYPRSNHLWESDAVRLQQYSHDFLPIARSHIELKFQ